MKKSTCHCLPESGQTDVYCFSFPSFCRFVPEHFGAPSRCQLMQRREFPHAQVNDKQRDVNFNLLTKAFVPHRKYFKPVASNTLEKTKVSLRTSVYVLIRYPCLDLYQCNTEASEMIQIVLLETHVVKLTRIIFMLL